MVAIFYFFAGLYALQVAFMTFLALVAIFVRKVPLRLVLFNLLGNLIPFVPLVFLGHTLYLAWKQRKRVRMSRPGFEAEFDPELSAKLQMAAEHFEGLRQNRGPRGVPGVTL